MADYAERQPAPQTLPVQRKNATDSPSHGFGLATPRPWQPKLRVGSAHDPSETEADNAAKEVVYNRGVATAPVEGRSIMPLAHRIARKVQRMAAAEEEAKAKLQRTEEKEAQLKLQRQEDDEANLKIQREEKEEAQAKCADCEQEGQMKVQRADDEEGAMKVQREDDEEGAMKVQREDDEEGAMKVQREDDEEGAMKVQRVDDEEAAMKIQREEKEEAQAKCDDCEKEAQREDEEELNKKDAPAIRNHREGFTADQNTTERVQNAKAGGEPLPEQLKSEMESGFGADFSNVKIHRGAESGEINQSLAAKAFTTGNHVFFGNGQFDPHSNQGKELIAHELTHTIQQGAVEAKDPEKANSSEAKSTSQAPDAPANAPTPENPVDAMVQSLLPGTAAAGAAELDAETQSQAPEAPVDAEKTAAPGALEAESKESDKGAEAEAAVEEAAPQVAAPVAEGGGGGGGGSDIPDVVVDTELEMPTTEKQRIAGEINSFKGERGKVAADGGEIGQFLATETKNVCSDAAESTAELAANESEHPTTESEVAETEAAEEVPEEFGQQMGNAGQVTALEAQGQNQEDAKGDDAKDAMLDELEENTPETLGDLRDYDPSTTASKVTGVVGGEVAKVQSTFGQIEEDPEAVPVQKAEALKPVAKAKETAKMDLGKGAVPGVPEEMTNMDSYQDDMDKVMAEEGITEEQMAMVDSGPLAEAQQGRKELKDKVNSAPNELQAGARQQAKTVESEMDKEERDARKDMRDKRKDKLGGVLDDKKKTKSKLELEREKVTNNIKQMYTDTETKVKTKLESLEKENEERFMKAVARFTEEFKTEVNTKVKKYLDKRHSGWFGWARAAKDWLVGVDDHPEVLDAFKTAKETYIRKVDDEIKSIIQYNNTVIKECKDELKKGKDAIDKYVSTLKPSLQDAGKKAAGEMKKKFEELDNFINEKQKALVDKLCAMKEKAIEHIDKVAEKMKEELSGALSKLIGLVVEALLKFFNWALGLFGYGMDNLEQTIVKTKRTLTFMVKHPIDFMSGLFSAVGKGFSQFGDNIQQHLISGLVMWLTGGMREEPIQLPDKWDLKGIIFFIMEVLGLGWANLRKKLVKYVGERTMGLAEKGVEIVTKLITEGPIAFWEDLQKQGEEIKEEIFGAVREMIITELVKQGIIFLLSLTNPASGIVKAIKAIYDFVMWFFNNIQRIMEMVKKIFDSASNIVEGNYDAAANAIERVMGLTIPVIIDLFMSILGLGGIPKRVIQVIKKVGGKLNSIIDKLLAKVAKTIKKIFGGKKGGTKDGKKGGKDGKKGKDGKLMTPQTAMPKIIKRVEKDLRMLKGKPNDKVGLKMKAIYTREAKWVNKNVKPKANGKKHELLLIPEMSKGKWWVEIRFNPKQKTVEFQRDEHEKGTGGTGIGIDNGEQYIGMFHGSKRQFTSAKNFDMDKLKGRTGDGKGLEFGSGLYMSHYFKDVKGYAPVFGPEKTPNDGWINHFWVPKSIIDSGQENTPDPAAGDKVWEDKGDVVKGKWHHIQEKDWKFGFQWTFKDQEQVHKHFKFGGAKHPFPAADSWGRGRGIEYPQYFERDGKPRNKISNSLTDPWNKDQGKDLTSRVRGYNPSEMEEPQDEGTKWRK